jgi:hypothetical protein
VTGIFLEDHPPKSSQYHPTRVKPVTGGIVVHDAESVIDLIGTDGGAEAVAQFMANRLDPGCYHSIVDSDSIVRMGRYAWTMFHCIGANSYTLGLSFACRTGDFQSMPKDRLAGFITNGAIEAASMANWVKLTTGIRVPSIRITRAEAEAGHPGYVPHADMDPTRRSDPGQWFPWDRFLGETEARLTGGLPMLPTNGTQWGPDDFGWVMAEIEWRYRVYRPVGYDFRAELQVWGKTILGTLDQHEDPRATIAYIDFILKGGG